MITTDEFVFIHMHKTGGQSLNHILQKSMPDFEQIDQVTDDFCKLGGKAANFLLMGKDFDIKPILKKMASIPEKTWHLSDREKTYEAHKQTQSLLLIHDEDFRHYNPTYHKLFSKFEKELQPLIDWIPDETVRSIDKMPPQANRPPPVTSSTVEKVGRNEPCPCGSSKKFKQCHGRLH